MANRARITIGGKEAVRIGNGNLVAPGIYQLNLSIPDLTDGDHPVVAEIGATKNASKVFVSVRK